MTTPDAGVNVIDRTATGAVVSECPSPWTVQDHGEYISAVHDSAAMPEPADWASRLAGYLALLPNVELVGAKRLGHDGTVFSMGEFIVHTKGFHHLGTGSPGVSFRFPEEVDAIGGGVFVVSRDAFETAGGADVLRGALGSLDLSLRIRSSGGRCLSVPDVVVVDDSTPQPSADEAKAFDERWGFDWNAADLAVVQQRWAGSGLLWNSRLHGAAMAFEKYETRPGMHWESYATVDVYRQRADHLAKLVAQQVTVANGQVLDLGCGDGLFSHLIARQNIEVIGIDLEATAIEQANAKVSEQQYSCAVPRFVCGDGGALPFDDASMQAVAMFDVIEHLPNPIALLREVNRVLRPDGHLILSTPAWQLSGWSDPIYHVAEYTMDELARQVRAAGFTIVKTGSIGGVYRDLIVIAQRC